MMIATIAEKKKIKKILSDRMTYDWLLVVCGNMW